MVVCRLLRAPEVPCTIPSKRSAIYMIPSLSCSVYLLHFRLRNMYVLKFNLHSLTVFVSFPSYLLSKVQGHRTCRAIVDGNPRIYVYCAQTAKTRSFNVCAVSANKRLDLIYLARCNPTRSACSLISRNGTGGVVGLLHHGPKIKSGGALGRAPCGCCQIDPFMEPNDSLLSYMQVANAYIRGVRYIYSHLYEQPLPEGWKLA
jgi:hypothetical protein